METIIEGKYPITLDGLFRKIEKFGAFKVERYQDFMSKVWYYKVRIRVEVRHSTIYATQKHESLYYALINAYREVENFKNTKEVSLTEVKFEQ